MRETKSKPSKFLLSSVKFVSALIDWEKLSHNVFGVFFSLFSVSLCTKTAAAIYHQIIKLTPFLSSPFPLFVASSSISLPLFRTIHSRRGLCGVYSHSTWQNTTAAAASIFSLSLSHTSSSLLAGCDDFTHQHGQFTSVCLRWSTPRACDGARCGVSSSSFAVFADFA